MNKRHTTLRLRLLLLVLLCSSSVAAQSNKTTQSNGQMVSLQSSNEGDSISGGEYVGKVYDVVEEPPSFPGGQTALMSWLAENIHCPSTCKSISGRVLLSFIVETDGTLSNIQIVRNLDTEFDEECIRVVKAMPKWIPGKQYGQAVRVKYNLPLTICMQ